MLWVMRLAMPGVAFCKSAPGCRDAHALPGGPGGVRAKKEALSRTLVRNLRHVTDPDRKEYIPRDEEGWVDMEGRELKGLMDTLDLGIQDVYDMVTEDERNRMEVHNGYIRLKELPIQTMALTQPERAYCPETKDLYYYASKEAWASIRRDQIKV